MNGKKIIRKMEKGSASINVVLNDGRLSVTQGLKVLLERDMLEGEWAALWAVLRGDE